MRENGASGERGLHGKGRTIKMTESLVLFRPFLAIWSVSAMCQQNLPNNTQQTPPNGCFGSCCYVAEFQRKKLEMRFIGEGGEDKSLLIFRLLPFCR